MPLVCPPAFDGCVLWADGPVGICLYFLGGGAVQKKGKIKFADYSKGYGYILSNDATDPTETFLFKAGDLSVDIEACVPGTDVIFEVDRAQTASHATNVQMA
jgi:cold shock CspA family protein